MPNYVMQTTPLPAKCCEEIDKSARSFLWGSTMEKKRVHLISWDTVCRDKKSGGLGLRHSSQQNQALLMKLGWGLITNRDALRVRVGRGNYGCGNDLLPSINLKKPGSRTWSGIKSTWEKVKSGVEVMQDGDIDVRWRHEKHGLFSVSSAYKMLLQHDRRSESVWSKIWKLTTPHRCKTHVWLMLHDRLLTNAAKHRRGGHRDGFCNVCQDVTEDTLHVLRDCRSARTAWVQLIPPSHAHQFLGANFYDWVTDNLRKYREDKMRYWPELFCIICWILWRRRNERVHDDITHNDFTCTAEAYAILKCMSSAKSKVVKQRHGSNGANNNTDIEEAESSDWCTVRVDGAFSHLSLNVGCGGYCKTMIG